MLTRSLPLVLTAAVILADVYKFLQPLGGDVARAAAVIPADEVKKIFAADLDHAGYVVIEVGVFPANGREVDLSELDFTLLTDPNAISERVADVDAIAATVIKPPRIPDYRSPSPDVWVTTSASVDHASYPDPVTGRRTGATIVGVGAGVGVGTQPGQQPVPGSGSADADRERLARQLWQDLVPDGKTAQPVAGYLYFAKPAKKTKNSTWVLQWQNPAGRVNLNLPAPVR